MRRPGYDGLRPGFGKVVRLDVTGQDPLKQSRWSHAKGCVRTTSIPGRRVYPHARAVHDKPAPVPCIPNTRNATPLRVVSCHDQSPLTAYCLLLTAYCLLLTAYCLLLTAYCSLLTAHCSLNTSFFSVLTISRNPAAASARAVPSNPLMSFQIRPLR
jgi:hypothetical protein